MNARVKKSIAILVTVVMVLAMAVQSFAAPLSYANPTAVTGTEKVTGIWSKDAAGNWHFNSQGGVAKDGWYYLNTTNKATDYNWFCFDANGVMKTGWVQDKADPSVWYYAGETKDSSEGGLVKGWATDPRDGKRYYMDPSTGIMRYGWQLIGNVWYYFGEKQYSNASHPYGAMYVNEKTPDGYYVGSNGTWQQNTSSGGNSNDKPDPIPEYSITVLNDGNGTATASAGKSIAGKEITLTATPNEGYHFQEWNVVSGGVTITNNRFIMPAGNVTVKAVFEEIPATVTIDDILKTVSGGFPTTEAAAWKQQQNVKCYRTQATLFFKEFESGKGRYESAELSQPVIAVGSNWEAAIGQGGKITFEMKNNILTSITVSGLAGDTGNINGTYKPKYTVTFDMQGHGTQIDPINDVVSGSTISEPEAPTADGFAFEGWYKEAACTNEWKFDTDKVTAKTTLYAKWTAKTWGVIGDFSGWATDIPMTEKESNVFVSPAIELTTNNQFKVRYGATWDKDYGASEDPEPYVITSGVAVEAMEGGWNLAVPTDGEYTVTLNLNDYTITVTAVVVPVTGVTLEPAEITLPVGDADVKLTATVAPDNATNKAVTWSSSDESVATVDDEGNVHAVAAGEATITVTTVDGNKTATCDVTVAAPAPEINTIADVLATVDDFPTSTEKAWKCGELNSCYKSGDNLHLQAIKSTFDLPLTTEVSGSGNSFTCTYKDATFTFNMTEGKLTSIGVEGTPSGFLDGTYEPPAAPTFKAVAEKDTNNKYTLTFYYDAVDHSGDNITVYEDGTDNYLFDDEKEEREKWGYNSISSNVKSVVIDSSVENYNGLTSTAYMFYTMMSASSITGAEYLDVSNVTDMNHMFVYYGFYCEQLTAVPDVSGWNTENVTNMSEMFNGYGYSSTGLTAVPDVSGWNTGNVTNMSYMFLQYGYSSTALSFTLDLSKWSVAKVTNYSSVFHNAGAKTATWSVTIPAKTGNRANDATHWYVGDGTNYIVPAGNKAFTLPSTTLMKLKTSRGTAISDIIGDSIPTLASPDEAIYEAWNSDNSTWCYVFSDEDDADEKFLVFSDLMDSIRISLNKTAAKIQNEVALEGEEVYKYESQDYIIYFNLMEGHLESIEFESKGDEISSYDGIYRAPETIPDEIEIKETKESIETDDVKDIPDGETEKDEADLDPEVPEVIAEVKEQEVSEDNKEIVPEEQSQPVVAEEVIGQSIPDEEVDQKQPEQETN